MSSAEQPVALDIRRIKRNVLMGAVVILAVGGFALYASRPSPSNKAAPSPSQTVGPSETKAHSPTAPSPAPASSPAAAQKPLPPGTHVVLITIDSIRKDYVGCYGGKWVPTPNIDTLAATGVRFETAVTAVPITTPSTASILTGWYPANHTVRDDGPYRLPENVETLAEIFKQQGYATAAVVSSTLLDSRSGLAQGFATYDQKLDVRLPYPNTVEPLPQRRADSTVTAATQWLNGHLETQADKPFFLWVHFTDPQLPYAAPEPYATKYPQQPYLGEIAFVDEQLGTLFEHLRQKGVYSKSLIALVGSHGEGLGDHGEPHHGLLLYESTVAVPLVFTHPSLPGAPRSVGGFVVSTVDVAPTILGLFSFTGDRRFSGRNLFAPGMDPERVVYMETLAPSLRHSWRPVCALRGRNHKFIEGAVSEYFVLNADTHEDLNLFQRSTTNGEALRAGLIQQQTQAFAERTFRNPGDDGLASETLKKLVEEKHEVGSIPPDAPPLDVRRMVRSIDRYHRAFDRLRRGAWADAADTFRSLLEISPYDGTLWGGLATALSNLGELRDAAAAAIRAASFQPRERHWLTLAAALLRLRDPGCADTALAQMTRTDPTDGGTALVVGMRALSVLKFDEALKWFSDARSLDPIRQSASSYAAEGDLHLNREKYDSAREAFDQALAADPAHPLALDGMLTLERKTGKIETQIAYLNKLLEVRPAVVAYANELAKLQILVGREEDAVATMKKFLANNPNHVSGLGNLGNVYQDLGRMDEAIAAYRKAIEISPSYVFAHYNLGNALVRLGDYEPAVAEYRRVLELQPAHPKAPKRLLAALMGSGKLEQAFVSLEEWAKAGRVDWSDLAADGDLAPIVGSTRFDELRSKYPK